MIGKVAFGSICTAIALLVALRSDNKTTQVTATIAASSCFIGFTATTLLLERHKERKSQETLADVYLETLRQMNRQRIQTEPRRPVACRSCVHYHGRVYGGNMLVCAMHPYGVEDEHCQDWEREPEAVEQ